MAPSLTATMTSTEGPFIPFLPPSPHDTPNTIPMQHRCSPWQGMSQLGINQWHDAQKRVRHGRIHDVANHVQKYHQRRKSDRRSALKEDTERQTRLQLRGAVSFDDSKSEEPREDRIEDVLQAAKSDPNGTRYKATKDISQTAFSPRRRSIRRVIPGLPRPPTFKRVLSERRDKLYPIDTCQPKKKNRSISTDPKPPRYTPCSSNNSSPPNTPTWFSTPEMRLRNPDRSSSELSTTERLESRSPNADESGDIYSPAVMQPFGLLPPPHFGGEGDDPDDRRSNAGEDGFDEVDSQILQEIDTKWILNLSMHFRDQSDREKFFLTYAKEQNQWLRVTVTCDYRNAPDGSLEGELKSLHFQRDKSNYIYRCIRNSLPDIDFYDTVTNLRLETQDEQLHVHVTEDVNEIIAYPSSELLRHINIPRYQENAVQFESHLSGFVYKVRVNGQIWTKKEIPGPGSVDEFLYEVEALNALHGAPNVIQIGGLVVDESGQLIKGLLINYAEQGSLADLLGDTNDLPWSRRQRWAKEIVAGLSELHESGYVQGDFTLSNIVIDEADHARIIDVNRRGCPMGWEPPEFFPLIRSGQRIAMHIGVKCDLFQLGMVLWALAEKEDVPEKQERPLAFSSETERMIPRYFQHIVRDCLSEHPRGRPSAKDLLLRFSLAIQDDHETARGRSGRSREGSGNGDNRVISEVLSSADVLEERSPIHSGRAAVNQNDVELLRQPRPRPHSVSCLRIDDFPAGAVTYGNAKLPAEHTSNLHRQHRSQSDYNALPRSSFTSDQLADTLSLLSSEVGESIEAGSSSGEDINAESGQGRSQYADSSRWQQIYDAEGTRQLINRASLSTAAQDEGSLMSGEIPFLPSVIATTDSSHTAWNTSSIGSFATAQLASPLSAHKAPTQIPGNQDRAIHGSTNDDAKNGDVTSKRENEDRSSLQTSLFKVERECKSEQDSVRKQFLPLVPEAPRHSSYETSGNESFNQSMRYNNSNEGVQQLGGHLNGVSRSPYGEKSNSYSGPETGSGGWIILNVSDSKDDIVTAEKRISGVGPSFHQRAKQLRQSYVMKSEDTPESDGSTFECLDSAISGRSSAQQSGEERQKQNQKESEEAPTSQTTRLKRRGKDGLRTSDGSSISGDTGIKSFNKAESKSYDDLAVVMNEQSAIGAKALVQRAATLPASSKPTNPSLSENAPGTTSVNSVVPESEAEKSHSARKLPFFMHAAIAAGAGNEDQRLMRRTSRETSRQPPLPFLPSFSPASSMDLPLELQNSASQTPPPVPSLSASSISQTHASATPAGFPSKLRLATKDASASKSIEEHVPCKPIIEAHRRLHRTSSLPIDIINTRPKNSSARGKSSSTTRSSVADAINRSTLKRTTTSKILPQNIDDASPQTGIEADVDAIDLWL